VAAAHFDQPKILLVWCAGENVVLLISLLSKLSNFISWAFSPSPCGQCHLWQISVNPILKAVPTLENALEKRLYSDPEPGDCLYYQYVVAWSPAFDRFLMPDQFLVDEQRPYLGSPMIYWCTRWCSVRDRPEKKNPSVESLIVTLLFADSEQVRANLPPQSTVHFAPMDDNLTRTFYVQWIRNNLNR